MKLLCTDLDRTLLPNGAEPENPLARPILWQLLETYDLKLAYVSGRNLEQVLEAIAQYQLKAPDVIVADVGASIYWPHNSSWQLDAVWESGIATDWIGLSSGDIQAILAGFDELKHQEPQHQATYKRSYFLDLASDQSALACRLTTALAKRDIKASLVFSDDPLKGVGLLDVLPARANKLQAIHHVRSQLSVSNDETLFSGDSGNDVIALASAVPGVVVANADEKTRAAIDKLVRHNGHESSTYQAEGGLSMVFGETLNGNYAAGIVEGLLHFNPSWIGKLDDNSWLRSLKQR